MKLAQALGLSSQSKLAIVGAGGKTSALSTLAKEFNSPVIVTTSTHIGVDQLGFVDHHIVLQNNEYFNEKHFTNLHGIVAITGEADTNARLTSPDNEYLDKLFTWASAMNMPVLIEADGARGYPLKAPADHEPAIPIGVNHVLVVAGLAGINKPLIEGNVYQPEIFAHLSDTQVGKTITPDMLAKVLLSSVGGLKNIPQGIPRSVLLNQADDKDLEVIAINVANQVVRSYDQVIISRKTPDPKKKFHPKLKVLRRVNHSAAVILAAGGSSRMGTPKQLLDWHGEPLIRVIVKQFLNSSVHDTFVVVGSYEQEVVSALSDLKVTIIHNSEWQSGQASSIKAGLRELSPHIGMIIFSVCDQPFLEPRIIDDLIDLYQLKYPPMIIPISREKTGNPVLFDRVTFKDLMNLKGETGGKALKAKYKYLKLKWFNVKTFLDIDTFEQYESLTNG